MKTPNYYNAALKNIRNAERLKGKRSLWDYAREQQAVEG